MRVLFDHNVPHNLREYLLQHETFTARQMGWDRTRNGDLIEAGEKNLFDVFVTCDKDIVYQQNLKERKIAIVEIRKNNWPSLEPIVQEIVAAVDNAAIGTYQVIKCVYIHKSQRKPS